MKIIFIHGMNQQTYNAETLKEHWLDIFKLGINELHLPVKIENLDIALPFYADLITEHQLSNTFDLDAFLPKSLLKFHLHKCIQAQPSIVTPTTRIPILPYFTPNQNLKLSTRLYLGSQLIKDKALKSANELGIDEVRAELLPHEKADIVKELMKQGKKVAR